MSEPSWRTILDTCLTRGHGESVARLFGDAPGFRAEVAAAYVFGGWRAVADLLVGSAQGILKE